MKFLVLGGSAFALVLSTSTAKPMGLDKFEYSILVLLATLGMMVMVSANDLMSLYVGLELQSLALYVVAALKRDDRRATEAGLKYFVLGALSSGMLLYGASLVYGFTGMTQLDQIVGRHRRCAALDRPDLRHGVPARRHRLQDLRGAVPHVDARRLRGRADAGDRLLRRRPQGRRHGADHPRRHGAVRPGHARLAADRRLPLDRLDGARRLRRDRPEQPQAPARPIRRSAMSASRSSA